jgi:hypothetical protein
MGSSRQPDPTSIMLTVGGLRGHGAETGRYRVGPSALLQIFSRVQGTSDASTWQAARGHQDPAARFAG